VTPSNITPPVGNRLFFGGPRVLVLRAMSACPRTETVSWTVNGARPEATLFRDFLRRANSDHHPFPEPQRRSQGAATGGLRPTQLGRALSTAAKCGQVQPPRQTVVAGMDQSCPNTGSIACLLLTEIGTEDGPTGGKNPVQNHLCPTPEYEGRIGSL